MLIDFVIRFADDSKDDEWESYNSAYELCIMMVKLFDIGSWETEEDYMNYN